LDLLGLTGYEKKEHSSTIFFTRNIGAKKPLPQQKWLSSIG